MGPSGSGKTYSIRTLVDAGITPFVIFTEPGMEVVSDIPPEKLHWRYVPPVSSSLDALSDMAKKVNTLTFESLTKMTDPNRSQYNQFLELVAACNEFKCDRTGESFGSVDSWGTDRALVIDSLTGVNRMAMNLVVGGRPTKSMADWGLAQDMIRKLVDHLTTVPNCMFLLIAHVARERDEITGGTYVTINTLGQKLAPEIPVFFSDVVLAQRLGDNFTWSTAAPQTDTKTRNLQIKEKLPPTFVSIIDTWKTRGGQIKLTPPSK